MRWRRIPGGHVVGTWVEFSFRLDWRKFNLPLIALLAQLVSIDLVLSPILRDVVFKKLQGPMWRRVREVEKERFVWCGLASIDRFGNGCDCTVRHVMLSGNGSEIGAKGRDRKP